MSNDVSNTPQWYVRKQKSGICVISSSEDEQEEDAIQSWGPFTSQNEAIARRVGLIRAGKCQPA